MDIKKTFVCLIIVIALCLTPLTAWKVEAGGIKTENFLYDMDTNDKTITYYSDDSTLINLQDFHPSDSTYESAAGETFQNALEINYNITKASFKLGKGGSPTGYGHAVLYLGSGTFGTNMKPTGGPLATSDDFDISDLTTVLTWYNFTFANNQQYEMEVGKKYVIVFENPTSGLVNVTNAPGLALDITSPAYEGNQVDYDQNGWAGSASSDVLFFVYGVKARENYTVTLSKNAYQITQVKVNGVAWSNYVHTAANKVQVNSLYEDSTITITYQVWDQPINLMWTIFLPVAFLVGIAFSFIKFREGRLSISELIIITVALLLAAIFIPISMNILYGV